MYKGKSIAVVVPCYNEETKIRAVLREMPEFIDVIYVVDDCSSDRSCEIAREESQNDRRVRVIRHETNRGVGSAIATGYQKVVENGEDIAVVMAGDGQMDPEDLPGLLEPLIEDAADYVKGNRFFHRTGVSEVPWVRLIGNLGLSAMTKVVSGYWHISDTQCGYTAVSRDMLKSIDLDKIYPRYGCPNDILTRLNIVDARVAEVPVRAKYGQSWASKMKVWKVAGPILRLMLSLFLLRIYKKYIYLDGHPLVFCYGFGFASAVLALLTLFYILIVTATVAAVPKTALIIFGILFTASTQFFLGGFTMDYEESKHLCVRLPHAQLKSTRR